MFVERDGLFPSPSLAEVQPQLPFLAITHCTGAMPHCPRCGRKFTSISRVSRHLSQPYSLCANIDSSQLVTINPQSFLHPRNSVDADLTIEHTNEHECEQEIHGLPEDIFAPVSEPFAPEPSDPNRETPYREDFPGAARTWGCGVTFIQEFDGDCFTEERKDNMYYPFASHADWELGRFLLFSRMSMSLINQFLKLELVRDRFVSPKPFGTD